MKITYPISTDDGDGYLVLMESFEKSVLPDDIIEALGNVEIVDVTLERVSGAHATPPSILFEISNFIAGFLLDNENTILYFYCDDMHDIARRDQSMTPQEFRSHLFSKMFDRYTFSHNMVRFINTSLRIESDRDVYIHLIARESHLSYVNAIKSAITEMSLK
ncbi:hypothetical protein AAE250_19310 [Bacteroides sp. GD17]|jgi:hypothetical protein|uniref:hypothetical protein n=1 Tax=Bacteroides sp. GD17 TaxID=3139826 RepID=UPI0025EC8A75|nr:hypothetical protein [uncultured Bacteroides sp.]